MLVKLTTNLGSIDYPFSGEKPELWMEGCECEVSDQIGATLLKRGHAVEVIEEHTVKARVVKEKSPAATASVPVSVSTDAKPALNPEPKAKA